MNSPPLLLIVDDEQSLAESLSMVFEATGYDVLTAKTAEEGLKILEQRMPDVVLMDANLPGMSGAEAVERMRASDYPGIIVGISTEEMVVKMTDAGVDLFLEKPLEISDLLKSVEQLIDGRERAS